MLAVASSFFGRTNISQSYNTGSNSQGLGSRPATPGSTSTSLSAPVAATPPFHIGLWKIQSAWHKVTNKRVSIWTFDKRGPDMERLGPQGKERAIEVMKAELWDDYAIHLSWVKRQHALLVREAYNVLQEMVEPIEESRTEVVFASEPVLSSLELAIPDSGRRTSLVELDEIEIQKGILQICKGLSFLHNSAKIIHSNLCPESIVINGAGDWKISGLGLTIPLQTPGGGLSRWEFPTFDGRVPSYIQRSFDYMAPEYALDEQLVTASDMYSLGCVVYAVHSKGSPPFKNHGSLGGLRENASKPVPGLERLDHDLQSLLRLLITRHYGSRPTPETLPTHPFFSSLPISTLNFLDRSNFTAKTREEKISFMKGLTGVLDRFSDGLQTRKILPSLLEEMKDIHLLPYILPNVFAISQSLSASQFATTVLPSLKPLFAIREPPQNMLTLLDNLTMLQDKTDKNVFREHVLPLVYNALESEHTIVQERALKIVPGLCETIDFAEVQGVLFPRVAIVFTKTRILSVKVATLETFLSMVKTLDQSSLTQKLVPLLAKIRTKEPAVMMATLSVHEAMGFKVDREAVATLVLPQLWAMSMGPLLSVGQFQRFMAVIKKLGERVEKEHNQFLRDSQRLEDRSGLSTNGASTTNGAASSLDFESLVGRSGNGTAVKADKTTEDDISWDDDVWGSILSTKAVSPQPASPVISSHPAISSAAQSASTSVAGRAASFLPRPFKLNSTTSVAGTSTLSIGKQQERRTASFSQPSTNPSHSFAPSAFPPPPGSQTRTVPTITPPILPKPHGTPYNPANHSIGSLTTNTITGASMLTSTPMKPTVPQQSGPPSFMSVPSTLPARLPMPMGGLLQPSKPRQPPEAGSTHVLSKNDWGDFDPLS